MHKKVGYSLVILGAVLFLYAVVIFDTTVAVNAYTRVHNLGLLNEQKNLMWLGAISVAIGAIFIFIASGTLVAGNSLRGVTPQTHVKCPDCKEFVLKEASVCKHCGCRLVPQNDAPLSTAPQNNLTTSIESQIDATENIRKSTILVHGYEEHFAANPSVTVFKDGDIVGEVGHHATLQIEIEKDCELEFKCLMRTSSVLVRKSEDTHILLSFNRFTGGLEAVVANDNNLDEKRSIKSANAKNNLMRVALLVSLIFIVAWMFNSLGEK